MTKGNQNRDELIQSLQERLRWYMSEASEEEFDADEVEAIGRLLEAMDGDNWEKPDAEAAYERFQAYCRERELEEKAGRYAFEAGTDSAEEFSEELAPEKAAGSLESGRAERAARETEAGRASAAEDISSRTDAVGTEVPAGTDAVGTEIPAETGKRRKSGKNRVLRRAWAAVAAALCLMFLGVGGMSIALNDGEWFLKLRDRDDGEELWVVPSEEFPVDGHLSNVYYSYEELDEENKKLIKCVDLNEYGLYLNKIGIEKMVDIIEVCLEYKSEEGKNILVDYSIFANENVMLYKSAYDDLDSVEKYEYKGIQYNCYRKCDEEKNKYIIVFEMDNIQFVIIGNLQLEDLKSIAQFFGEKR